MCTAKENCAHVRRLFWDKYPRLAFETEVMVEAAIMEQTVFAWPAALAV